MTSEYSDLESDTPHAKEVQFEGSEYKRSEDDQSEDDESGGGQSEDDTSGGGQSEGGIQGLYPFHPKEVQFEGSEYKRSEDDQSEEDESEGGQSEDDESGGGQSEGGIKGLDPFTIFGADDSMAGQDTQGVFSGKPMHDPQYVQRVALAPAFGPQNMPNALNPSPDYAPSPTPAQSIKYMQGYTQQPTSSQPTPGGPRSTPTPRPFSTGGDAPPGEE